MFFKKKKPKHRRSIEDIFTAKENSEKEAEIVENDDVEEEIDYNESEESTIIDEKEEEVHTKNEKDRVVEEEKPETFTESALKCFGWKEVKTEKWLVKCAKAWYGVMSFAWFLFGAITFAPIAFMQNKVNAIFNDRKKSLAVAITIYILAIGLIAFSMIMRKT